MKIQNVGSMEKGTQNVRGPDQHGALVERPVLFRQTLHTTTTERYEGHIREMMKGIDEQGKKLGERADIKEFARYRQLIRDFMDEVVSNGFSFSKEASRGARGRHRMFAMVKTVDEKLDALAKTVLEEQADQISLLDQVDDIRGLLLDMLL